MLIVFLLSGLIIFVLAAHFFCVLCLGRPLPEVKSWLLSSDAVAVDERSPWLVFRPSQGPVKGGVIFHPGGYVDHRAYARVFHLLAQRGYLCVIVAGPQKTPMIKRFAADDVIAAYPEITRWFIGGHSQGGAVASLYVRDRLGVVGPGDKIAGMFFLGFFVFDRHSHADRELPCISIYGDCDGHVDKFKPNEKNLPKGSKVLCIEGGNHGQFAAYGLHFPDGEPTIARDEQQALAVAALADYLDCHLALDGRSG